MVLDLIRVQNFPKNVIIFSVDMSSSMQIDNKKRYLTYLKMIRWY